MGTEDEALLFLFFFGLILSLRRSNEYGLLARSLDATHKAKNEAKEEANHLFSITFRFSTVVTSLGSGAPALNGLHLAHVNTELQ
jgi:hypothetical protein